MKILGIETSCDETAAAVVEDGYRLLSSVVASSMEMHVAYGGVVPEIAARSHIEHIMPVILQSMAEARAEWTDIDAVAVTQGPGLGGSLLIGVQAARTISIIHNKPLYAVNHVLAHPYAAFITDASPELTPIFQLSDLSPEFPMLALIVSGGHTQLVLLHSHFDYELLGQTQDDAVGEAFDKAAKILGLPYPGGPSIAVEASKGDPSAYSLPKSKMSGKYDFSFSGLKTALLRTAQSEIGEDYNFPSHGIAERLSETQEANLAASFQHIAAETVVDKTHDAYHEFMPKSLVVAGGVASSVELRQQIAERIPIPAIFPDIKLCTDNAAMIAVLGYFMAVNDLAKADPYSLNIEPNLSI